MNTIKGYLYTRVSSLKQVEDKNGLQRQSDLVTKWLRQHPEVQLDTEFTFKDAGKSAFKARHIEKGASLSKFLAAVESGLIQTPCYLLIEHLDRITRLPPTEARERVVTPLMKAGVTIVTVSDGLTYSLATVDNRDGTTPHIDMLLTLFLNMAYQYSKKLSDRVSHAKKNKRLEASEAAKEGKYYAPMGAMCPQYLDVVAGADGRRVFVPNPERVAIVKRIFRERAHTDISINQIARDLNSEGVHVISHHITKKGKPEWTAATVSTLLKNEAVLGILRQSQHKTPGGQPKYSEEANYYPQVIDLQTWEAVQRKSLSGKPVSKREFPAATNIFRGYIDCKHCNRRMTINGVRPDFPGSITCRSARTGLCDAPTYSMAKFENAVIGCLFAKLSQVETSDGVDSNLQQAMIERQVAERKRDNFIAALADAESLVVINVITKNMDAEQRKVDILTDRIEKLQRAVKTQTKFSLDGLDLTVKADREKARDIISEHIQQIVLDTKSRTVDVYLRNGNGIERFKLENPHDQTILLTEMLAPKERMLEISTLTGVSKVIALASSKTSDTVDDREFPEVEPDYPNTDE